MAEPRPKRERAAATGPRIEAQHGREPTRITRVTPRATVDAKQIPAEADASRIEVSQIKTVRFKKGVAARAMLHQIQLVPDPRGRVELLLQAMTVHAKKMSVLNAESAFGKMLALHLCDDEEKFQDDQIQRRLKTLQEEYDLFGNSMWGQEEAAPAAELGLGLGYYPSAKKQRGEGSSRD